MEFWVSKLRLSIKDPMCEVSEKYPNVDFKSWYLWNKILLKFGAVGNEADNIKNDLERWGIKIENTVTQNLYTIAIISYGLSGNSPLFNLMDEHHCLDLPPSVYREGRVEQSIASFNEANLKGFIKSIRKVGSAEVLSKRRYPINVLRSSIWLNGLFSSLTRRQTECFLAAQNSGYYTIPRKTTTEKLSRYIGIKRTAYETHLRKAEDTILNSVAPYFELFFRYEGDDFHRQTLDLIS
jgi:predicted DNA binding protein